MKMFQFGWCLLLLILGNFIFAQNNSSVKEIRKETQKLEKAVDTKDESAQAQSYVNIADSYYNAGNYPKSEENFKKAQTIYQKLNDQKNLQIVSRKLAQSQEKQDKITSAVSNYEKARSVSKTAKAKSINTNDITRISSPNAEIREEATQKNLELNSQSQNQTAVADNYSQMAEVNIQQNNIPKAEENLKNAYEISKESAPVQALEANKKLTDIYVNQKNFDKAIEAKKAVLKEDFVKENTQEKVNQIQELADIYIQKDDREEAIILLKDAYKIAIEKGHTLEAQQSVRKLDSLYNTSGETQSAISLHRDFLKKLPNLVANDRSLVDNKILQDTESRIVQLEKEKKLQEELIRKKNIFNYSLLGALALVLGLAGLIFWTLKKVQTKNKKIALQSLRREMNPHFIFNSLNSVNHFIATNNEMEANQYLTKFSKLMRGVMENSTEDFIPFQQELDLLENYLALEKTRFVDKFDYEIIVDEELNTHNLKIPGMLIQPFLENAIWHGLRYREEKGWLKLHFIKNNDEIIVTIEDNGIGIDQSRKQKTEHQKNREGRGMKNTLERISLLNDLYSKKVTSEIIDKTNGQGVLVKIII